MFVQPRAAAAMRGRRRQGRASWYRGPRCVTTRERDPRPRAGPQGSSPGRARSRWQITGAKRGWPLHWRAAEHLGRRRTATEGGVARAPRGAGGAALTPCCPRARQARQALDTGPWAGRFGVPRPRDAFVTPLPRGGLVFDKPTAGQGCHKAASCTIIVRILYNSCTTMHIVTFT